MEAMQISMHLVLLNELASNYHDVLSNHRRALSYRNGADKANWAPSLPDGRHRDTFNQLWKKAPRGTHCWAGFFSTPSEGWVGHADWDHMAWHCWAAAIVDTAGGKQLLIYDPDPQAPHEEERIRDGRFRDLASGPQRRLQERLERDRKAITGWWFSKGSGREHGCLRYTFRWLESVAKGLLKDQNTWMADFTKAGGK